MKTNLRRLRAAIYPAVRGRTLGAGVVLLLMAGCPDIPGGLDADFSADELSGYVPLTVEFTDQSRPGETPITAWEWDFGDGATGPENVLQNPVHTYGTAGSYTVSLTVTDEDGDTDYTQRVNYITVNTQDRPTAAFEASPVSGMAPLTVEFEDLSTPGSGDILLWGWDFGDDSTSEQSGDVTHTYTLPGVYTVTLAVHSEDDLYDQERKLDLIEVSEEPIDMVTVPAGWFRMGADDADLNAEEDELPPHFVLLDAYEIGLVEVTNAEYVDVLNWARDQEYLGNRDGDVTFGEDGPVLLAVSAESCNIAFGNDGFTPKERDGQSMADHPVAQVTWKGAAAYCNWLSERFALEPCYDEDWQLIDPVPGGYRLPTEAEWECAAGWDSTREDIALPNWVDSGYLWGYPTTDDALTTVGANFDQTNPLALTENPLTTTVGYYTESVSPVGCFDMAGNVWEWCYDRYAESYSAQNETNPTGPDWSELNPDHVLRGGGWASSTVACRTTNRREADVVSSMFVGFRVARNVPENGQE